MNAYICSGGQRTIGYGHANSKLSSISEHHAHMLLLSDIAKVEKYLNSKKLDLSQNQFDALVSFIFNVGFGNFEKSTLLATLDSDEFNRWIYVGGVKSKGLIKRRKDEKDLFDSDCSINYRLFCWQMHTSNKGGGSVR